MTRDGKWTRSPIRWHVGWIGGWAMAWATVLSLVGGADWYLILLSAMGSCLLFWWSVG